MLKWLKGLFAKGSSEEPKPTPDDRIECNSCGHVGTTAEFLQKDAGDTFCPVCGEDDELTFEV